MIHYGKTPQGDLEFRVPADAVGEVFGLLESAVQQCPMFSDLKEYISREFADEVERYRRRMTAQIPVKRGGAL